MSAPAERHQPSLSTAGYLDGLGRRTLRFDRQVGGMLQALELRPEFSLYETLLRDSAARLAGVRDPRVAGILSIEREGQGLVVCSPLASGDRLEELLETRSAEEDSAPGIDAALGFLVRAIPAVALLHRAGLVHGILAPGRLVLTPSGDVVLLDCIYAAAVERVRLSPQRLWASLRVAVTPGATRFDRGTDVRQVALSAIAIALGRTLEEPCTPQVIGRLLQELAEVAQIRAGERFATELRSLLDTASSLDQPASRGLEETGAEAQRLARALGMEACLTALSELAGTRVSSAEIAAVRPAIAAPLHPLRADPPVPIEPAAAEEPSFEPELSLDVTDTVEISLDAPGSLDFEAADEASVLVLDASEEEAALFDWEPDRAGMARRPAPQASPVLDFAAERYATEDPIAAADVPAALDWASQAEAADREDAAAVTAADVVPWQLEVRPAPVFAEPPVSVEPAAVAVEPPPLVVEPPAVAMEPLPVAAGEAAVSAADVTPPPAPPPGIPLFRRASPSPAQTPSPVSAPPSGQDERRGLKLYVPPPAPAAPPAPPAPVFSTVFAAPAPVVVVAHAPPASVPLRIKEDPAPSPRPRRMLDTFDDEAQDEGRGASHSGEATRRSLWKLVAAATVVLAVGAFAGLPFLANGPEPAAAETAPVAAPPPSRTDAKGSTGGGLHIETQPSGAAVLLDGEDVGRTPLKLEDVKPGRHVITLSTDSTTVKRTVRIEAGNTVTLDVPVYSGWVAVYSPVPLHISEGARMLGTTETTRVMLSPGRHELTLTSRELGYTARQSVDIVAGEERVLNIEPRGSVSVNASPWAEVFVDGARMGETPLANLDVPLGTREFVFKHPTYGERRITITITSKSPPLSVDFTRPGTRP